MAYTSVIKEVGCIVCGRWVQILRMCYLRLSELIASLAICMTKYPRVLIIRQCYSSLLVYVWLLYMQYRVQYASDRWKDCRRLRE